MATIILHTDKHTLPRRPADIPQRLTSIVPPTNFGAVVNGQLFRSAYPQPHNVSFMKGMKLKTIVCLVDTENSQECADFIDQDGIRRVRLDIAANKGGKVKADIESIYDALLIVMDVANYPLLIHCNQGKHRTGCVIACLRKMQGWSDHAAVDEYRTYSNPKSREGDELLISEVFQPEAMLEYCKTARFDHRPSLLPLLKSDLVDVDLLVRILASMDGVTKDHKSVESNTSYKADSGIDLCELVEQETGLASTFAQMTICNGTSTVRLVDEVEVSVEECGPLSPPL